MTNEVAPKEQSLEKLLTKQTVEQVARNILSNVTVYNAVDKLALNVEESKAFSESGTVRVKFGIGKTPEGGGFIGFPSTGGLGQPIMGQLKGQGFDVEADGMGYVVNLSEAKFKELTKTQDDGKKREAIKATLNGPNEEQQARIDALRSLIGKGVENDSRFIIQTGTMKVASTMEGKKLVLQFSIQGSDEMDDQGGVIVDAITGAVIFHPAETRCNTYLKKQSEENAVAIADDFIRQLNVPRK